MMESILQEKRISFKEFEKKIFQFVCGLGQEIAKTMQEPQNCTIITLRIKLRGSVF